jgi:peptidoglycan/xylan/chitin deacetylase (PgdA/CDA1 family)
MKFRNIKSLTLPVLIFLLLMSPSTSEGLMDKNSCSPDMKVPILLYHRFGPERTDSMTVTTSVFESHLKYLMNNGYKVIPLRQLVDFYLHRKPPLPSRSVVITVDDGHKTVYTEMLPLVKKYRIPVTLFIYPSAISNASYAMTWDQLKEIKKTGLFDFQSHSYWHPNFKKDKKRLKPSEYEKSVEMQLKKSKEKLEKELGVKVDMIAWPFGIYDKELVSKASDSGYIAAFTLERRHSTNCDNLMTIPRYLMTNENSGKVFERMLAGYLPKQKVSY